MRRSSDQLKRGRLIGKGIRYLMLWKGYDSLTRTREEIADHIGIEPETLRNWERGRRETEIDAEALNRLALQCAPAPGLDPDWVSELFSANGMGPEYISDELRDVVNAQQQHIGEPTVDGTVPLRGPSLHDQGHHLQSIDDLVGRNSELERTKEYLTSVDQSQQPAAKIVVVGGMPGVGKTALAQWVGRDPEVEDYFQDGVLWAELGREPNVQWWLREWAGLLGMPNDMVRSPGAWLQGYLASEERRALIILDDVWPETPFDRLMIGGPQCRVLITSQVVTVANMHRGVQKLPISTLEHNEALALALGLLEREATREEREGLEEMVEIVERLPLAIRVAVAVIKSQGVAHVVEQLRPDRGDLLPSAEPQRVEQLAVPGAEPRQTNVQAAFRVGYQALEDADQRRFRLLGDLPQVTSFGVEVLAALWGGGARETRDGARRLVDRSLLDRVGENRYRIHSLLQDFAAGVLKASGEQDAKRLWVERHHGAPLGRWRWWWPSVSRPQSMPRPFSRAWFAQGGRELRLVICRRYWDVIRGTWNQAVPAEVWVVGQLLHQRAQRHLRRGKRAFLVAGFVVVVLSGLFVVLRIVFGERVLPEPFPWYCWLLLPLGVVIGVSILFGLPGLWILTVDYINFHRFYHSPVEHYEAIADE